MATAAGVSRRWLSDLESGKATAEIGLILKTLHALDIVLDAKPIGASEATGLNLDDLLRNFDDSHE
ncbi:hypothetical protein SAMN05444365_102421 [Micromonospora pattaloongensis]|uniref:Helix-turn-helix domain-containing protein n=1 Tax=Micromonospora pattaloongensis TaxID=405436 RepID=A0A1H3KA19_9ACTN|nr:hypothetical protein SAMN05444365_102421 [Micromonospora pattaloongensis]